MRISPLFITVLGGFLHLVNGYGQKGFAERITLYSAYLAEELMGDSTLATGCRGAGGGRCNFDEFMSYIWAPRPDHHDVDRPVVTLTTNPKRPNRPINFLNAKLATMLQNLGAWKANGLAAPISGNIDSSRLFADLVPPAEGEPDPKVKGIFEAMSRVGDILSKFGEHVDGLDGDAKAHGQSVLNRAKQSTAWGVDLRVEDLDNNAFDRRVEFLDRELGFTVARKTGRNSSGRMSAPYTVWDRTQTIADHPDRAADIDAAAQKWEDQSANNKDHADAFRAAEAAERGACGGEASSS